VQAANAVHPPGSDSDNTCPAANVTHSPGSSLLGDVLAHGDGDQASSMSSRSVPVADIQDDSAGVTEPSEGAQEAEVAEGPPSWEPTVECPKPVATSIRLKLERELQAVEVEVVDESASHAGHSGARETVSPSGETHMKVAVVAAAFEGLNTVKRHRLVYGVLKEELAGPVHALSLDTKAPDEA
jgi:BolA family transcriptional regulator, general stress-responsive regulator